MVSLSQAFGLGNRAGGSGYPHSRDASVGAAQSLRVPRVTVTPASGLLNVTVNNKRNVLLELGLINKEARG